MEYISKENKVLWNDRFSTIASCLCFLKERQPEAIQVWFNMDMDMSLKMENPNGC
jgi:hypothetical protein